MIAPFGVPVGRSAGDGPGPYAVGAGAAAPYDFVSLAGLLGSIADENRTTARALSPVRIASDTDGLPASSETPIKLPQIVITPPRTSKSDEQDESLRKIAARYGLLEGVDPFAPPGAEAAAHGSAGGNFLRALAPHLLDRPPQADGSPAAAPASPGAPPEFATFGEAFAPYLFDPFTPSGYSPVEVSPRYAPQRDAGLPKPPGNSEEVGESQPEVGRLGALGLGAVSGLTANLADELYGLDQASGLPPWVIANPLVRVPVGLARLLYERSSGKDGPATKNYRDNRDYVRRYLKAAEAQHRNYYLGGQIASGLATLAIAPELTAAKGAMWAARAAEAARATRAAPALARSANSALAGAAYGALAGAGEGEGWLDRAARARSGLLVGGLLGAALPAVAQPLATRIGAATRTVAGKLEPALGDLKYATRKALDRARSPAARDALSGLPWAVRKVIEEEGLTDKIGIGKFAVESIPARSSSRRYNAWERAEGNRLGYAHGCHSCGTKNPGTDSENFVLDHQPASALSPSGGLQRLYPQCLKCSLAQGLAVARISKIVGKRN